MVTNSFGKRNFMQPMGRLSTHKQSSFFLVDIWGGDRSGERGILFFSLLPNVFPSCSHQVPKYVSQDVLNSTSVLSHMVCPKLSPCQLYRWAKATLHLDIETAILGEFSKS
jgi:hypothetical protein